MRWQFGSANDLEYVALRKLMIKKIEAWWTEFERTAERIAAAFSRTADFDIPRWMATHLHAIDPRLMWEFGPAVKGPGHRLVITPETDRHLRPLTSSLLKRAPDLAGWEFYGYRLPEGIEKTHQAVKVRTGFDSGEFRVRIQQNDLNRIDLCYFAPNVADAEDENALNAAFVTTETLLGEEHLDKWVGSVEVSPSKKPSGVIALFSRGDDEPKHLISLNRMKETFDAVISSILEQLPTEPHSKFVANSNWSVFKLTPEEPDDYPQQLDLFVSTIAAPQMWAAAHSGGIFFSGRYSRCGEIFCYVKIDASEGLEGSKFADRAQIEDAITGSLMRHGLGCTIGSGTGLRYSYVELALTDYPAVFKPCDRCFRPGEFPTARGSYSMIPISSQNGLEFTTIALRRGCPTLTRRPIAGPLRWTS